DVGTQRPLVTEGVCHNAIAVAPELVLQGHGYRGPGRDRLVKQSVDVFNVNVDRNRAAAQRLRRASPRVWKLFVQHEDRIADLQGRVHHFPVRSEVRWSQRLRPKGALVEVDRPLRIADDQMRSERMKTFRNRLYFSWHFSLPLTLEIGNLKLESRSSRLSLNSPRFEFQTSRTQDSE